jgi:signal transduction histidine kinase
MLPYSLAIRLVVIIGISYPIMGVWIAINKHREGNRMAMLYLIAFTLFLSGCIILPLKTIALLPKSFLTDYGVQIGSICEMILLSLGLAYKIEQMHLDISQLNLSLEQKNRLLTESLEDLSNETASRKAMVKDLAHRGNNPLHAIQLSFDLVRQERSKARSIVLGLFGDTAHLDADAVVCYNYLDRYFKILEDEDSSLRINLERLAEAIAEIRTLSGIDGHALQEFSLPLLLEKVIFRLKESIGKERVETYLAQNLSLDHHIQIFSQPTVVLVCLEKILRHLLQREDLRSLSLVAETQGLRTFLHIRIESIDHTHSGFDKGDDREIFISMFYLLKTCQVRTEVLLDELTLEWSQKQAA